MVEEEARCDFNFLLVNRYETGEEYMGWHRDNEKNASQKIASLSLGERRKFRLKEESATRDFWLDSGSLLIFDGYLKHTLPKMKKVNNSRINLTFRRVID
jgi:alkylated DNA repair dioxygenase AlkB